MIEIKQFKNNPLKKIENVVFDINDYDTYIELFEKYKEEGILDKNDKFGNNIWHLTLAKVNKFTLDFSFSEVDFNKYKKDGFLQNMNYDQFIISLKSYILKKINVTIGRYLVNFLNQFREIFKYPYLEYKQLPDQLKKSKTFTATYKSIANYITYIENNYSNIELLLDYEDIYSENMINSYKEEAKNGKKQRILPTFESMFKFNDLIDDFIKTSEGKQREKFYPIILWWKITTIIPLRSHEIVLIPLNCVSEHDDDFFLKFVRNNIKGNLEKETFTHSFEEYYAQYEFPISKELFDLISEYKLIVDKYDKINEFYLDKLGTAKDREFLFSYRSFKLFRDYINTPRKEDEYFLSNSLNDLRKLFFKEIVQDKYNLKVIPKTGEQNKMLKKREIEYIQLMDTRHFAIMNMIFMGYEPSTVQRIVGHKNIRTSYDYFNHTETFINCYTLSVARQMAFNKNTEFENIMFEKNLLNEMDIKTGDANKRYNRIMRIKKQKKEVEGGFCTYENNDLLPCKILRGNHNRCPYYVPIQKSIEINKELNKLTKEISAEVKILKYLIKNKSTLIGYRDAYRTTINKLHSKVNNKAELLSNLFEGE